MNATADGVAQNPWLAIASAVASFLGLALTLYSAQVKNVQTSVYRTLLSNRVLLLASGVGLFVGSGVGFVTQVDWLDAGLQVIRFVVLKGETPLVWPGTNPLWMVGIVASVAIVIRGYLFDPLSRAQAVLVNRAEDIDTWEKAALEGGARRAQTTGGEATGSDGEAVRWFYQEMRYRLFDMVVGPSPYPREVMKWRPVGAVPPSSSSSAGGVGLGERGTNDGVEAVVGSMQRLECQTQEAVGAVRRELDEVRLATARMHGQILLSGERVLQMTAMIGKALVEGHAGEGAPRSLGRVPEAEDQLNSSGGIEEAAAGTSMAARGSGADTPVRIQDGGDDEPEQRSDHSREPPGT